MSLSPRIDSFSSSSMSNKSSSPPEHKKGEDTLDKTKSVLEACLQASVARVCSVVDVTDEASAEGKFLIEDLNARIDEINEGIVLLKLENDRIERKYRVAEEKHLKDEYFEKLKKINEKIKLMKEKIQDLENRKYAIFQTIDDSNAVRNK